MKLAIMAGNWWTTLLGAAAGIAYYVKDTGARMPSTKQEWWTFGFGALLAATGLAAKDATTGSRPGK